MLRSPESALQQAVYNKLKAATELMEALAARNGGLFDNVPDKTQYPRVVLGEGTLVDFDTESDFGAEQTITIHVWSDQPGQKETKQIMGLIYQALHEQEITPVGFNSIFIRREFSQTLLDGDGATRHGVMRFRSIMDEVEDG